ncbi:MAG: DUF371 domain-containing protein [Candidatus Thorarchaeota archaeon]
MNILDTVSAYGHPSLRCTHRTTIEVTKDNCLTTRGTCILGINATKACYDLSSNLKEKIINGDAIKVIIKVEGLLETFIGYGDEKLNLKSKRDMVFRKSNFICDRTVLINCTKSSSEINRDIIRKLNTYNKKFTIIFEALNFMES